MAGINKVILIGNLGKDPEVRYLEGGSVVANVTIATTETYKDRNGNKVENTEWHDLEMWDGLAKIAEQYLSKGKTIYVEGKIKSDVWQDDQGMNRKKIRIRVLNMTMLGGPGSPGASGPGAASSSSNMGGQPAAQRPAPQSQPAHSNAGGGSDIPMEDDSADDLPF